MKSFPRYLRNRSAFTLIEVAVVMVLVGLVAGGGVVMLRALVEQNQRNETAAYLSEVRQALLTYANVNGKLPYPDTAGNDGVADGDATVAGTLPYKTLGLRPKDAWSRNLKYQVHPDAVTANICTSFKNFLNQDPDPDGPGPLPPPGVPVRAGWSLKVWDADATSAGNPIGVALIVVSLGANGTLDNASFTKDGVPVGCDNATGNPYLRQKATESFDDLVLYQGPATISYWAGCQ